MSAVATILVCALISLLNAAPAVAMDDDDPSVYRCEKLTLRMCTSLGYNYTFMPNRFNHLEQAEAGLEANQFWPLVPIDCSPYMLFFLCGMYVPVCATNSKRPIPVCRHVCERAKAGCLPVMKQYGFSWPEKMTCSDLPERDSRQLCMFNSDDDVRYEQLAKARRLGETPALARPSGLDLSRVAPRTEMPRPAQRSAAADAAASANDDAAAPSAAPPAECQCECRAPLVRVDAKDAADGFAGLPGCAMACRSPYFSPAERQFTDTWLTVWAATCAASTLLTLLTFAIDRQRFQYPERPIIWLSLCYLCVSVGYIVRLIAGHEAVACRDDGSVLRQTTGPALCAAVFLLVYGFGMASCAWWVILSLTWFLAAALKWSSEAIERYAQYFHLAAWLVPGVQAVVVLAKVGVDGDSVAGICYVGNLDLANLRAFVVVPLCVYLLLGAAFLVTGFVSLFRIRSAIKRQGRWRTEKLEHLMVRIGVFAVLYCVPAVIVIACHLYEQHFRDAWQRDFACRCAAARQPADRPDFSVLMLKYFMSVMVGVSSAFWVCSEKTLRSWGAFGARLFCCRSLGDAGPQFAAVKPPCAHGSTTASFRSPTRLVASKSFTGLLPGSPPPHPAGALMPISHV